jgi:hypothetical protein
MKRASPKSPNSVLQARVQPSAVNAELALREGAVLMAPVAEWMLRHGVAYPLFAEMMKGVFLEAARAELERGGSRPTQSALSLLSGVHRKDVRTFEAAPAESKPVPRPPLSAQVFTRWLTDRRYRLASGKPRPLPRTGEGRSFESLCRELSSDVHPRTVLDELLRLGHVALDDERVVALAPSFVPAPRLDEMTALFSASAADHIAAAVSNITLERPKFLEQSIYADGLTAASIEHLHAASRVAWSKAFEAIVTQARARVDADSATDGDQRMRFGVYFYSEPVAGPSAEAPAAPGASAASGPTSSTTKKDRIATRRRKT